MNSNIPREKRSNLSSNILKLQVNKFISNRNNQIIMPSTPINAILNTNGFLEILNGAIKCSGNEVLESIVPKEGDLSIKQNNGFSLLVWVYVSISPQKRGEEEEEKIKSKKNIYYIFRRGSSIDVFTPELGIVASPEKHFFVGFGTTSDKKTTILANKCIEENHLYSLAISFKVNYELNTTEINIYIDGKLDTQTRIPGQPLHNQENFIFGKVDFTSKSFKGVVADLMIAPNILNEKEINFAHIEGLKNLYKSNGEKLDMNLVLNEIFKKKRLINKYSFYTGKSVFEIENLNLNAEKMLEIVKNYGQEEKDNDIREIPVKKNLKLEKMMEEMRKILTNEDERILCNKIDMNNNLMHTCLYLANQGEDNLEISRVINIFNTLKEILLFDLSEGFIIKLSKILYSYIESDENGKKEKYLIINKFFENLHKSLDNFESEEIKEEIENEKYKKKSEKNKKNENLNYLLKRKYS